MNIVSPGCVALLLLCCCGSSKSNESKLDSLEFAVTDSLLQKPVLDKQLKASFRPPKNWEISLPDSLRQMIGIYLSNKAAAPLHTYYCPSSRAFMVVEKNEAIDAQKGSTFLSDLEQSYKRQIPQSEIHTVMFKKYDFRVYQIIVNAGPVVLVSLFFNAETCSPFKISFLLPFNSFAEHMKIVESVIGSVNPIDDTKR